MAVENLGSLLIDAGKLWLLDRMVWLNEDIEARYHSYPRSLY